MGIYIHIPFCRQACRYCDFYFTVSVKYVDRFVQSLIREIRMAGGQRKEVDSSEHPGMNTAIQTIYLGGGTPSVLSPGQLERIVETVREVFPVLPDAEITLECNPDDLNTVSLSHWRAIGFNRLSIGVQSFFRRDLELLRRSHDENQAIEAVQLANDAGFSNLNMDLIYGIPGQSVEEWHHNLETATSLSVTHLSAYHLTFESGTVFEHWRKKGRIIPVPENHSLECFRLLREHLLKEDFEHYEISNFARPQRRSRHNMIYWSGLPYLGFGPSAHSFDGTSRRWNISSLHSYMENIGKGKRVSEGEELTVAERYHDYLITSLRTSQGVKTGRIAKMCGLSCLDHFERNAETFIEKGIMHRNGDKVWVDPGQWLITDHILQELFLDQPD